MVGHSIFSDMLKSAQSFGGIYRGRVCVRMFIGVSAHTCMSIYVCIVFLKKYSLTCNFKNVHGDTSIAQNI
jgi:hypothetical protein